MSTTRRCNPACRCADALRWLAASKHDLAPLTGTDTRALKAIAHCWDLYAVSREPAVLVAGRALVSVMQPDCRPLARELIAWAMDWSDRIHLWPLVIVQADQSKVPPVDGGSR